MRKIFTTAFVFAFGLAAANAWALNGNQFTGNGPVQASMNGAGVAAPLDSTIITQNPAGLVKVTDRFDFAIELGIPIGHSNTSAAPAGNAAAGNQETDVDVFPIPAISTAIGLLDGKMALGLGFFEVAGNASNLKQSRVNPALTGNNYDRYIDYRLYKIMPGIAYSILDNLSIGATAQIGYAMFSTDMAVPPTFKETKGMGRTDNALGFGGSLGILYSPIERLSLGVNYTSRMLFPKFKKYDDIINNNLDMPHQLKAGISGKPFDNWLLALDFHWINWSGISMYGDAPSKGGLGWRDQYCFDFGTQYSPLNWLHLRAGYGYGRSPIPDNAIFANAIAPLISQHAFGVGFGFDVAKKWTINTHYGMNLKHTMTESGTGDAISAAGTGTKVDLMVHSASLGVSYKWGKPNGKEKEKAVD